MLIWKPHFMARSNLFWQFSISRSRGVTLSLGSTLLKRSSVETPKEIKMTIQTAVKPTRTITNGVNVNALCETVKAVKQTPQFADFRFRVSNQWMGGDHNRTTVSGFHGVSVDHHHAKGPFVVDNAEPPVLLGEDEAPNPVEYVLHALAGCLTTSMVYHAAARGIVVESVTSELEGDLDLRGFLGLSDEVRKGFSAVRVVMRIKSDADIETLKSLTEFSPVYDIVSKSLPVEITMENS
jgi:uncharacterized OsmC-like protein